MRILVTFFILLFSSSVFADEISNFEIEGISVGDSLLDYFSEEEIRNNIYHYYTQFTFKNTNQSEEDYDKIHERINKLSFWHQSEISHSINFSLGMFNFVLRKV